MRPLVRGLVSGFLGFGLGAGLTALVQVLTGRPVGGAVALVLGYLLGLAGWLLGVGVWHAWVRQWFGGRTEPEPRGWRRYLAFCTDHKVIGVQYLVTFVVVFLLAGALAMLMRVELSSPGLTIMSPDGYNTVMSLHGILMITVAVAAVMGGLGNYLVPLMIGAEDMAFPRLNALSYWLVPPAAVLLLAAPFAGGLEAGWTAYPPLSEISPLGQVLFVLAIITFGLSSILGGLNFLATIITMRAPGMTWGRLPIFVWSIFAASVLSLLFTQFFAASVLLVLLDRVAGMAFFDAARGGKPLLYQHLFWFYSHPAVYIMILPGFGIALEVLAHFSRKPLFAYPLAVAGFLGIVVLSGAVWGHHMFTSGMSQGAVTPFMVSTELISIPTGLVFLSALGTIWRGRLWLATPMLFALAFVFNFLIGGITGIFLADVATDVHLTDTYFVVAHFHYTIVGGEIFALFAGIYYWFPKMTGRMYHEGLGRLHAWWMFLGFNLVFLPMFWLGVNGMNRRVADYVPQFAGVNRFVSVAAFFLGGSFLVFAWNVLTAWIRGPQAAANPWGARTLEWQIGSPPPRENFPVVPEVVGGPYDYGLPGAVHARLGPSVPIAGGELE
ncbi:MAG TPA: cbb3-type cytochrome c oxidase subunit I [Actinomycetota bacterium]|nr:cbb3-type cytochrome c oxidase subunit I [Actinomycetota bacterium]